MISGINRQMWSFLHWDKILDVTGTLGEEFEEVMVSIFEPVDDGRIDDDNAVVRSDNFGNSENDKYWMKVFDYSEMNVDTREVLRSH